MTDLRDKLFDAIEEVMTKRWAGDGLYRVNSSELVDSVLAVLTDPPAEDARAEAERDKLLAKIEKVRELHKGQVDDFGDRFCVTCWSSDWPCLTLQAIGEVDE